MNNNYNCILVSPTPSLRLQLALYEVQRHPSSGDIFSVRISNGSHMVVWHNFTIITSCFIDFCCNPVIIFILFSYISQSWKRCKYVDIQIFSYCYLDELCAHIWQNHNSFVLCLFDIKSDFRLSCSTPQCIMEH